MFEEITYMPIFGMPLIIYSGIFTFISFIITAFFGMRVLQGKAKFEHHKLAAIISITLAVIHGLLGFLVYI